MAIKLITDTILTSIANAIRAKTGKSASMTPADMATEIASIGGQTFDWSQVNGISFYGGKVTSSTFDVTGIPTGDFTNFSNCFYWNGSMTTFDGTGWDTSSATDMNNFFSLCSNLASVDVSTFDVSHATNLSSFFSYCTKLTSLDLAAFHTDAMTNMANMFRNCSTLTSVNLWNFDTTHVTATGMNTSFTNCSRLTDIIWSQKSTVQPLVTTPEAAGITATMNFYVPDNLVSSYQAATNWATISSQIHGISDCPAAVKALYNIS